MTPNPFLTIWLSPRKTIRRIIEWNPTFCVIWLACLFGVGQVLNGPTMSDHGDKLPISLISCSRLCWRLCAGWCNFGFLP
ncbi:MAG: hypothetical protein A2107_14230 [Verrucomicrobia bacterium GWF2_62_7]|nr:MAG: hypothetical protein A2107_14230 [Verrucomicrobia bacterium GWF2_62_7]